MKVKVIFEVGDYVTNATDDLELTYFNDEAPYFKKNYVEDTFQVGKKMTNSPCIEGFLQVSFKCADEVEIAAETIEEALTIAEENIDEVRENYFDGEGNIFSDFYIDGTFEVVRE